MVPMRKMCRFALAVAAFAGLVVPARAVPPGVAAGTLTLDGTATRLAFAASGTREDLYDSSKRNTVIVLSDRDLGETSPDDDYAIKKRAEDGQLVALAIRLDGRKLVNAYLNGPGVDGTLVLPGAWFAWKPGVGLAGSLTLAKRDANEHTVACAVDFAAAPGRKLAPPVEEQAPAESILPPPAAVETLPPATTTLGI